MQKLLFSFCQYTHVTVKIVLYASFDNHGKNGAKFQFVHLLFKMNLTASIVLQKNFFGTVN